MEGVFIWALGFLESVALNYKYNIVLESILETDLDLFFGIFNCPTVSLDDCVL